CGSRQWGARVKSGFIFPILPRAPYACNGSHASYPHERKRPLGNVAGVAPRDAEACTRYHLGLRTGGERDKRWKVLQIVELLAHQEEHRAGYPCEAGGEIVHAERLQRLPTLAPRFHLRDVDAVHPRLVSVDWRVRGIMLHD